jgi:hypothetical protein
MSLAGEKETAATFRNYAVILEERRGIPHFDLREPGGSQHMLDLLFRPADLFHSFRVAAPKTPFLHEPLAITPGLVLFQIIAVSHGENDSRLLDRFRTPDRRPRAPAAGSAPE